MVQSYPETGGGESRLEHGHCRADYVKPIGTPLYDCGLALHDLNCSGQLFK